MIIEDKKVVSIVYELRKDSAEGEIVENLKDESPLVFLFGTGGMLPKFEENLAGLKSGSEFKFNLDSENAYGVIQENAIVEVPKNVFTVDGEEDKEDFEIKLGD